MQTEEQKMGEAWERGYKSVSNRLMLQHHYTVSHSHFLGLHTLSCLHEPITLSERAGNNRLLMTDDIHNKGAGHTL